jgi:tRNA dimethylallyltransferase
MATIPYSRPRILCLAGPTATGKSEIALLLAEQLGGEIISVDSMQVYRGMDIGTAKPGPGERRRVPHHLIDVVDLANTFDAAQFARLAHKAVEEIRGRNRLPILCGGTGLYFRAFLEGLGDSPAADPMLRAQLEATPMSDLLQELKERDPATFEKIDHENPRRVVRALEVIRLTGKPFSVQRAAWASSTGDPNSQSATFIGLLREPEDLHSRIAARVERMFRLGLVEEVRQLLQCGLAQNRNAVQAIGYRQVVEYLGGERSLTETVELVKIRTRQFAKRQITWFRQQAQLQWIECAPEDTLESLAAEIAQIWTTNCRG